MGKILIIPDVHGRTFWKEAVAKGEYERIIFLGDYLDPYPHEEITQRQAYDNLLDIIELKKKQPEQVILLLGNHDMHYFSTLYAHLTPRVRYNASHAWKYQECFAKHRELFQLAHEEKGETKRFLFTHAGVTKGWYNRYWDIINELNSNNLNRLLNSRQGIGALTDIGALRGGASRWGSCVWADFNEMSYSETFDDWYQVFGHSQADEPSICSTWACLDCRKTFELNHDLLTMIDS